MGEVVTLPQEAHSASEWPLIPPGEYQLKYLVHETKMMFRKQPKVCVWFQVMDFGEYFGTRLCRFYNAQKLIGNPRKNGGFVCSLRSDLMYEYAVITNQKKRRDRLPLSQYGQYIILGEVKTVKVDFQQRNTPAPLQYSVVKKLIRAVKQ